MQEECIHRAINKLIKAKQDNSRYKKKDDAEIVSVREVSEEYALEQIRKGEKI